MNEHITLSKLLLAGIGAGVISIFTSWLITGVLFHRFQRTTPATWREEGPLQYALSSVLAVVGGIGMALLFAATGGVSSIWASSWAARGVLFGFLVWVATALPMLLTTATFVNLHRGVVTGLLLDALAALVLIGFACAWASNG